MSQQYLQLDSLQLCHVNQRFPWLSTWSTAKCPASPCRIPGLCKVITPSGCRGTVNRAVSTLHIPGLRQQSDPSCPTACSVGRICTMNTSSGCSSPMHLSSVCVLFPVPVLTGETKCCGMGASVRKQQAERSRAWGTAVSHILQCSSQHQRDRCF